MIPFLRPCRAAAPRMTRGRSPVPGPCGRRAAAGSRSRGRPAQGAASSAVRRWLPAPAGVPYTVALAVHLYRGFPPPRASRSGRGASAVRRWAPAPAGVPYTVALAVHLYRGFPLPRASRSGRGASAVRRWAPAPAGVPRHHPPLNLRRDGFPLPRRHPPPRSPCGHARGRSCGRRTSIIAYGKQMTSPRRQT